MSHSTRTLLDEHAIQESLYRYCRGVDRVVLRSKPGRAPARDVLARGRYVDRWSRRDGRRDDGDASHAAFAELRARQRT